MSRRYFIQLGSGEHASIVDIANFVYYYKNALAAYYVINCMPKGGKDRMGVTIKYDTKEERDKDFHRLFIATQEYGIDEIHNLRQTKGSEE